MPQKIVVLGGGISGLSVAYFLSCKGIDVNLLEQNTHVGGAVHTTHHNGYICESGANTVLINNTEIAQLLKSLNLLEECIFTHKKRNKRYLLEKGQLVEVPSTAVQFLRSPLFNLFQKLRILMEPLVPKHEYAAFPSVKSFVVKRFGKALYHKLFLPFITGIYAGNPEKMSVRHALKQLYVAEQQHGNVLFGFMKELKQRNKILRDLGVPPGAAFTFKNGLGRLPIRIQEELGEKICCGASVNAIGKEGDGFTIHFSTDRGQQQLKCDQVVSTLPANANATLLSALSPALSKQLNEVVYVPMVILHLGFSESDLKNKRQGFGVLTLEEDKQHYLGVLFSSRTFAHVAPKGKALFTVFAGGSRAPEMAQLSDEEIVALLLPEIKKLIQTEKEPDFLRVSKWQQAIPQYGMQHHSLLQEVAQFHESVPQFHLSGNYLAGVSVSDCIANASYLATKLANQ
jgi:oxygen-dependent protoporphyrinogen oxidase